MSAAPAVLAIRAKKHVYLQKPMAPTLHECRVITQEAKKNGVVPKVDSDAAPDADSDLPDSATGDGDSNSKDPQIDPEREEALNILADLAQLSNGPKTASTTR